MKKLIRLANYKTFFSTVLLSFTQLFVNAQDKVITTTTRTETYWYTEPWVWVTGGIVVVILLAVILSGRNKTTIIEKTTRNIE